MQICWTLFRVFENNFLEVITWSFYATLVTCLFGLPKDRHYKIHNYFPFVCVWKNTQPTAAFTEIAMLVLLDKLKVGQRRRVALEDFTNKMMNSQKHHHELGRTGWGAVLCKSEMLTPKFRWHYLWKWVINEALESMLVHE